MTGTLRIFMDFEFDEDGTTIDPLSGAWVTQTGQYLYVVIQDADHDKVNPWVRENVLPHLYPRKPATHLLNRSDVAPAFVDWLTNAVGWTPATKLEFWADYASYDWLVFCQFFGTMLSLPETFPKFCHDIQNLKDFVGARGIKLPEVIGQEHCALDDARNVRDRFEMLEGTRRLLVPTLNDFVYLRLTNGIRSYLGWSVYEGQYVATDKEKAVRFPRDKAQEIVDDRIMAVEIEEI